jgi:hypothetical protein
MSKIRKNNAKKVYAPYNMKLIEKRIPISKKAKRLAKKS